MGARPVICVTPVRNEAWILERFLACASVWADVIVVGDNGSTDDSRAIAASFPKVEIVDQPTDEFEEPERRGELIDVARGISNDALLVAIDADEALSADGVASDEWTQLRDAPVGTCVGMRHVQLLPGLERCYSYRSFPIALVDDGSPYAADPIHGFRLPLPAGAASNEMSDVRLLHFQYTDWDRMRSKHHWYMCWERVHDPGWAPIGMYRKYHHMYRSSRDTVPVDEAWFTGYEDRGIDMRSVCVERDLWWDRDVVRLLDDVGPEQFAREAIWDVDWDAKAREHGLTTNRSLADPRTMRQRGLHRYLRVTQPHQDRRVVQRVDSLLARVGS